MASEIASAVSGKTRRPERRHIAGTDAKDSRLLPHVNSPRAKAARWHSSDLPGRGKTTSLIKVALSLGLAQRVPVRIYTAGAHSVGGQEQMARYATILGTPWQAYESLAGLNLALNGEEMERFIS